MSTVPESRIRGAEATRGLKCPQCGEDVYPCHSGESSAFYCRSGHRVGLSDLASIPDEAVRAALEVMLRSWKSTLAELQTIAADAERRGLFDVAAIYQRQVGHLRDRLRAVQAALWAGSPAPASTPHARNTLQASS